MSTDSDIPSRPSYGWPNVFSQHQAGLAIEDVWPSLYFGAERVEEMKRKAEALPWARKAVELWQAEAEVVLLEQPRFVRGEPGSPRTGMYISDQGQHLVFDPRQCDTMLDPATGRQVQPGENQRRAWTTLSQERVRRLMSSLGVLYRLTSDERYSRWVWEGLRAAVTDLYAPAVERRARGEAEHPYSLVYSGLYESQCMLQLIQALHLVQGAPGGGDEDRKAVEVGILTPAGEVLSSWMDKMMVHNMSCWANAALALLGRHLDRSDWLEKALHSEPAGLQLLLTRGVPPDPKTGRPDGFWHEASTFYNFYALIPLIPLYRVGEEEGAVDDEMRAHFRAMFGAPLHLVDCNLRLLTVGDRAGPGQLSLTHFRHVYEYAAGQVDTERYGPLLSLLYEKCGAPRTSLAALAWGPDELPPPCDLPRESAVLGGARMVTFRKPSRWGDLALWFVGGEENNGGQAHHHHDKLSFSFHAGGEIVSSDLGLPSFQDNVWAMFLCGTFSHNTLLVDEVSQGPMESLEFEADLQSDVPWAHAAVCGNRDDGRGSLWKTMLQRGDDVREGAHDDVVLARTILFDPPYIVLSDRGEAPDERRFSSVLHARGDMIVEAAPAPDAAAADMLPLPSEGAFGLLVDRAVANPVEQVTVDWRICDGLWLRLVATGDGPLEATWGRTPGNPRWETRGTIVLRGPGRTRRFGAVLELHSGSPTVRSVNLHEDEGVILTPYEGPPKVYSRPARAAEGEGRSA